MPDIVEMSEGLSESIIMYRWAFGGKAETLEELRASFAPGQDKCAYLVGKDVYAWDDDSADFNHVGQWQGPIGPSGPGIPEGGATGQVLIKSSNLDFETAWGELKLKTNAPLSGGGNVVDALALDVAAATDTTSGVVRIATSAETVAGVKDDIVVCPARLKELLDTIRADIATISSMPVGTVFEFAAETPPDGALVGDGSLAPIEDYSELFEVVGYGHTPDGLSPPTGYFYLPNYMDYFLRGHNPVSGRKFGSAQGDAIRNITGSITNNHGLGGWENQTNGALSYINTSSAVYKLAWGSVAGTGAGIISFDAADLGVPTAEENRPMNKTVLICIKY